MEVQRQVLADRQAMYPNRFTNVALLLVVAKIAALPIHHPNKATKETKEALQPPRANSSSSLPATISQL